MATKADVDSPQIARKSAAVDEIRAKLEAADAAVLTEYRGLTVTQLADLRAALRPAGTEYKICKNTLLRRAASAAGRDDLLPLLEGPVAVAFVQGDAVLAAKALRQFSKDTPALVLKGGVLGERVLEATDVEALAEVAPREELLARLAGGFNAPLARAAGLFSAFTRNFAYGLKAYVDQRVAAGEAAPEPEPEPEAEPASEAAPEPEPEASTSDGPAAEAAKSETPEPAAPEAEPAPEPETPEPAPDEA